MASQQRGDPEAVSSVVQAEGHGLQPGDEDAARLTNLMRHTKASQRSRAAARYFDEKKPKGTPP